MTRFFTLSEKKKFYGVRHSELIKISENILLEGIPISFISDIINELKLYEKIGYYFRGIII